MYIMLVQKSGKLVQKCMSENEKSRSRALEIQNFPWMYKSNTVKREKIQIILSMICLFY